MQKTELSKQWIFELFIQLVTQQETRDSKFAITFDKEMHKLEAELGQKLKLNLSEIHLIATIGDYGPINVTAVSEKTKLTKGSITRICKKLSKLDLIRRQMRKDNKKEVFIILTAKGQQLHSIHNEIHNEIEKRFMRFLDKYSPEQLAFSRELLQDLLDWDY